MLVYIWYTAAYTYIWFNAAYIYGIMQHIMQHVNSLHVRSSRRLSCCIIIPRSDLQMQRKMLEVNEAMECHLVIARGRATIQAITEERSRAMGSCIGSLSSSPSDNLPPCGSSHLPPCGSSGETHIRTSPYFTRVNRAKHMRP